jgi:cytochrome b561
MLPHWQPAIGRVGEVDFGERSGTVKLVHLPVLHRGVPKHHSATIALHWGTVLCLLLAVAAVLLRELTGDKIWRIVLLESHRQLGLLILMGVAARLYVRQRHGLQDHMQGLPWPMRLAATTVHWLLYGLLCGLPLLGWATSNAHNIGVRLFGLVPLPALAQADSELADVLSDYHILGAWVLLGMVSMHAAAALYHHFVRRDTVLWAMLPEVEGTLPAPSTQAQRRRSGLAK